jgi:hypothetical protein
MVIPLIMCTILSVESGNLAGEMKSSVLNVFIRSPYEVVKMETSTKL